MIAHLLQNQKFQLFHSGYRHTNTHTYHHYYKQLLLLLSLYSHTYTFGQLASYLSRAIVHILFVIEFTYISVGWVGEERRRKKDTVNISVYVLIKYNRLFLILLLLLCTHIHIYTSVLSINC